MTRHFLPPLHKTPDPLTFPAINERKYCLKTTNYTASKFGMIFAYLALSERPSGRQAK